MVLEVEFLDVVGVYFDEVCGVCKVDKWFEWVVVVLEVEFLDVVGVYFDEVCGVCKVDKWFEWVIDEVTGMWLALWMCGRPLMWLDAVGIFLAFRVLDIVKPFPIGWIDRRLALSPRWASLVVIVTGKQIGRAHV